MSTIQIEWSWQGRVFFGDKYSHTFEMTRLYGGRYRVHCWQKKPGDTGGSLMDSNPGDFETIEQAVGACEEMSIAYITKFMKTLPEAKRILDEYPFGRSKKILWENPND